MGIIRDNPANRLAGCVKTVSYFHMDIIQIRLICTNVTL